MAKILITGASGFVGSWLVKEALSNSLETYAGIRSTSNKSLLNDNRIKFCVIDFNSESSLRQLLEEHNFDYIIHNAGVTRAQKDADYFRVNAEYSATFARLAMEVGDNKLKKFIYISSIEAFGSADNTPNNVIDHLADPCPRTTYGRSKLRGEKELLKIKGLPLIILRPTAVFGPAERDLFEVWKTIKRFRFAPTIGSPNIKYTFVYVKDLARIVINAAKSDVTNKAYFVGDGRIYNIKDFTSAIAESLGVKTFGITIPYMLLEGAVGITKWMDKLTGKKSLLNDEQLAKMRAQNWDVDIAPLVQDLSFQAQFNLKDAIEETTEWYREMGWL